MKDKYTAKTIPSISLDSCFFPNGKGFTAPLAARRNVNRCRSLYGHSKNNGELVRATLAREHATRSELARMALPDPGELVGKSPERVIEAEIDAILSFGRAALAL